MTTTCEQGCCNATENEMTPRDWSPIGPKGVGFISQFCVGQDFEGNLIKSIDLNNNTITLQDGRKFDCSEGQKEFDRQFLMMKIISSFQRGNNPAPDKWKNRLDQLEKESSEHEFDYKETT